MVSQVSRQARILLVDDRVENLIALDATLSPLNQILVSVQSGEAALEALRNDEYAVVLLDIVMPKRNGYEILRALRKDARTKTMPIVLVSSKSQESDKVWGKRQGADEYLAKPFTSDQLLTMVKRFAK